MSNKFAICFPSGDGKMICQHHNGNWIVFPIYARKYIKEEEQSEEATQSVTPTLIKQR